MNRITKLKILGHEYSVTYDEKLDFNERTAGQINWSNLTIKVCPKYPPSRQEEALLHEIIEAINFHLELKLEHPMVNVLSEVIYQVLSDNKMIKWIK